MLGRLWRGGGRGAADSTGAWQMLRRRLSDASPTSPATRKKKTGAVNGPVSSVNFSFQIDKVLSQIYEALDVGIIPVNADFKLARCTDRAQESVSLDAGDKGFYVFSVDWKMERLTVQTPISGVRQYEYEPADGTWLNTIDRHDMRGIVTRDLLRHAKGCPKF